MKYQSHLFVLEKHYLTSILDNIFGLNMYKPAFILFDT